MLKFDKSKVVKNLAEGNVLVPYLDRVFQTFDEPWTFDYTEKQHDNAWHPSGDCVPVASALYDKAMGKERETISGSLRKSFMVGHYWHQLLQHLILHKLQFCEPDAIERQGYDWWGGIKPVLLDSTTSARHGLVPRGEGIQGWGRPDPYHWISGAGDIAPLETKGWTGIVDIKTMSSNQFKQPALPEWAALKYTCQMNIYMHLFSQEEALILGVNKDAPHDFKEINFVRDQNLIDAIIVKWHFVSQCLEASTRPTLEEDLDYALPGQEIS